MAPQKRKRSTKKQTSTPKKRPKHSSHAKQEDEFGSEKYFTIKDILDETQTHYLIAWAPDPKTKEEYPESWEPKENANELAVAAWEEQKQKRLTKEEVIPAGVSQKSSPVRPTKSRRGPRRRRVVESSSPGLTSPETVSATPRAPAVFAKSPEVRVQRPENFDSDQYEQFSDLPTSSAHEETRPAAVSTAPLHDQPIQIIEDRVIPDSQSLVESSSNVLTTQSGSKSATGLTADVDKDRRVEANSPIGLDPSQGFADSVRVETNPKAVQIEDSTRPGVAEDSQPSLNPPSQRPHLLSSSAPLPAGTAETNSGQSELAGNTDREDEVSQEGQLDKGSVHGSNLEEQSAASAPTSSSHLVFAATNRSLDAITTGAGLIRPEKAAANSYAENIAESLSQESRSDPRRSIPTQSHLNNSSVDLPQDAQVIDQVDLSADQHDPHNFSTISNQTTQSCITSGEDPDSGETAADTKIPSTNPDLTASQPPVRFRQYSTLGTDAPPRPGTPMDMSATPQRMFTPSPRSSIGASSFLGELQKRRDIAKRAMKKPEIRGIMPDEGLTQPSDQQVQRTVLGVHDEGLATRSTSASPGLPGPPSMSAPIAKDLSTSERLLTLVPVVPVAPGNVDTPKPADDITLPDSLQRRHGKDMQFAIVLPAEPMAADQYKQTIVYNKRLMHSITGKDSPPSSSRTDQAQELLERLENILTHVDLENDSTLTQQTQQEIIPEEQIRWDFRASTKFRFLQYLIEALRNHDKHVVILAKPGKTMDIVETFLRGHHVKYDRPDGSAVTSQSVSNGTLTVTLLPTSPKQPLSMPVSIAPDVFVALDDSFDVTANHVQELRSNTLLHGKVTLMVSLVVINSPQHIKICYPTTADASEKLPFLLKCVEKLRNLVGRLPANLPGTQASATEVARFLIEAESHASWTLPKLGRIPELERLVESQDDAQTPMLNGVDPASANNKRRMEIGEADEVPTKKLRIASKPDTVDSSDLDTARVSDSAPGTTQGQDSTDPHGQELRRLRMQHAESQEMIELLRCQLREREEAFDQVQTKYEDQDIQIRELVAEHAGSSHLVEERDKRIEGFTIKLGESRDKIESLRMELAEAQALARGSMVPNVAEMERLRSEARKHEEDNKKLEARLKAVQNQFEFTREQYQTASSAAAEQALVIAELRSENELLKVKASGETSKLHQILASQNLKIYQDQIEQLERMLMDREALLQAKEEEIRLFKGRSVGVGTRASSVPRSPRVSLATSRQPSPNPGPGYWRTDGLLDGRPHPLRIG